MNLNFKGKNKVEVKVIEFYGIPSFILEKNMYYIEGGLKGLVRQGIVPLRNVRKVSDGTMSQTAFYNLSAWEG